MAVRSRTRAVFSTRRPQRAGRDTGPVFACESVQIGAGEHAGALHDRLAAAGVGVSLDSPNADLLLDLLPRLEGEVVLNSFTCDRDSLVNACTAASRCSKSTSETGRRARTASKVSVASPDSRSRKYRRNRSAMKV